MPRPRASPALSYLSTIPLSSRTLNHLAERIRAHRTQHRTRWRRLGPGRQALLALAHLRNGDTYARLAAGIAVDVATAWCYVREAIMLLAAGAEDLATAMRRIRRLAYAIGRHADSDRPRGGPEAVLLRQTQAPWRQRPGPHRRRRSARVGLSSATRLGTRPHRRPHPWHHRRADQRGQGIPGRSGDKEPARQVEPIPRPGP